MGESPTSAEEQSRSGLKHPRGLKPSKNSSSRSSNLDAVNDLRFSEPATGYGIGSFQTEPFPKIKRAKDTANLQLVFRKKEQQPRPFSSCQTSEEVLPQGSHSSRSHCSSHNTQPPLALTPDFPLRQTLSFDDDQSKVPLQKKEKNLKLFFGLPPSPSGFFPSISPQRLSSLLQEQNHSLCRSILSALSPVNDADQIVKSIVSLHSQPDVLLLHCLDDELLSKGDLSIVAREQTPTVFVLKECLSLFPSSVDHLLFGLLKFGESLTSKHLHLLCDPFPRLEVGQSDVDHRSCKHHPGCKHSLKLRKKLQKETMKLLSASSIPIELCVLCHRCTLLIEQTPNVQRDESVPIENWTVTAFLFLRFIVPMVTTSSQREKNGKGISFLSRFLMKLCCRSKFRINGSGNSQVSLGEQPTQVDPSEEENLVNLILADCFEAFDLFCSEIRERGRAFWGDQLQIERKSFSFRSTQMRGEFEKDTLHNFVEKHRRLILAEAKKRDWEITSLLISFSEELQRTPPHTPTPRSSTERSPSSQSPRSPTLSSTPPTSGSPLRLSFSSSEQSKHSFSFLLSKRSLPSPLTPRSLTARSSPPRRVPNSARKGPPKDDSKLVSLTRSP